jgi:hypothetical protein
MPPRALDARGKPDCERCSSDKRCDPREVVVALTADGLGVVCVIEGCFSGNCDSRGGTRWLEKLKYRTLLLSELVN